MRKKKKKKKKKREILSKRKWTVIQERKKIYNRHLLKTVRRRGSLRGYKINGSTKRASLRSEEMSSFGRFTKHLLYLSNACCQKLLFCMCDHLL